MQLQLLVAFRNFAFTPRNGRRRRIHVSFQTSGSAVKVVTSSGS